MSNAPMPAEIRATSKVATKFQGLTLLSQILSNKMKAPEEGWKRGFLEG